MWVFDICMCVSVWYMYCMCECLIYVWVFDICLCVRYIYITVHMYTRVNREERNREERREEIREVRRDGGEERRDERKRGEEKSDERLGERRGEERRGEERRGERREERREGGAECWGGRIAVIPPPLRPLPPCLQTVPVGGAMERWGGGEPGTPACSSLRGGAGPQTPLSSSPSPLILAPRTTNNYRVKVQPDLSAGPGFGWAGKVVLNNNHVNQ